MYTKWYSLTRTHPAVLILCPQSSVEEMESARTKNNTKNSVKRQVKSNRDDICPGTACVTLLDVASTAPVPSLEGASIGLWTLADLQDPTANFASLDTNTVSVYDTTVKDTYVIVESNA